MVVSRGIQRVRVSHPSWNVHRGLQRQPSIGRYARLPAAHRWPLLAEIPVVTTPAVTSSPKTHDTVLRTYARPWARVERIGAGQFSRVLTRTSMSERGIHLRTVQMRDNREPNDLGQNWEEGTVWSLILKIAEVSLTVQRNQDGG